MAEIIVLQQRISRYLNNIQELVEMQNAAGDYTINKAAENIFKNILNVIYDFQLENTNLSISNYPSIDLASTNGSRICFQVTATNNIAKIKNTISTFFSNELHLKFDTLKFIILKPSKDYKTNAFKNDIDDLTSKYSVNGFTFDIKNDIIDKNSLYNIIVTICNPEQLTRIKDLLEQYYDGYKTQTNFSQYYEDLKDSFHEVVFDDESGMTLNDIYISPDFQIYNKILLEDESTKDLENRHYDFVDIDPSIENIFDDLISSNVDSLKSKIKNPLAKVIFILGFPGQGKTSFCKKIVHDHILQDSETPVFYLKLRNIRNTKSLIENPINVIYEELQEDVGNDFDKSLLKKSLLVLDGLDELYMKDNLKADDVERFCKELIMEAERLSHIKIIVTTRFGYVDFKKLYYKDFIALSLKPLTISQQKEWLDKYSVFHKNTVLTHDKLVAFNETRPYNEFNYIKELINQPLLLYFVASLNIDLSVKVDRAEIYNLLFDQIIERKYSKDGQIDLLKDLTKEDLRSLLHEVAFIIFCSGKGYTTAEELSQEPIIRDYVKKLGPNGNLVGTLKGVLISFYFKESGIKSHSSTNAETGIEFFHKSLQEYLAAEKIVDTCFYELLAKDGRHKYVLKYESDLLTWLNNLFGKQFFTYEIASYIKSIMFKKSETQRQEVEHRLIEHLEYFVNKDFLSRLEIEDHDPFDKILMNFQSYWFIIQALSQKNNIITSKLVNKKVIQYFNTIDAVSAPTYGIVASYQTFHEHIINFLGILDENVTDAKFIDTSFINSVCTADLVNVSFKDCYFSNYIIDNVELISVNFTNCQFDQLNILLLIITDVTFRDCMVNDSFENQFGTNNLVVKNLLFEQTVFDKASYDALMKQPFECVFKNCQIQVDSKNLIDIR